MGLTHACRLHTTAWMVAHLYPETVPRMTTLSNEQSQLAIALRPSLESLHPELGKHDSPIWTACRMGLALAITAPHGYTYTALGRCLLRPL